MDPHTLLGISAGILELISLPLYIRSIFLGETKPDRVTWWVLALVSGMISITYYATGARDTLWLPVSYTLSMLIVALLSLKYGEGPARLSTIDRFSVGGAAVSAVIWVTAESPALALYMNIGTELIGFFPTLAKSFRRPWTESTLPWLIATVASFFNVLAISSWTFSIAAYPIYLFATNAIVTYFLMRKRWT